MSVTPVSPQALVVIGASAGGVETLKQLTARLPGDLNAAICVVLHIAPNSPSALAAILSRSGPLPCQAARDGQHLTSRCILVAPPDRHLVVVDGSARLTVGPRENNHRPAVDTLFRSAAQAFGARVIGVILSGTRDDGTVGLAVIKAAGGRTVVQDPEDAMYPGMPASAIANVAVDQIVTSSNLGATIEKMVNAMDDPPNPPDKRAEADFEWRDSSITICPECGAC